MMRWLEEFELKHVEFMRSIKSFEKMSSVWSILASKSSSPANSALARKQAAIYETLRADASHWFRQTGEPRFLVMTEHTLVKIITDFREGELSWLQGYNDTE